MVIPKAKMVVNKRLIQPLLNGKTPWQFAQRIFLNCFFIVLWAASTLFIDHIPRSEFIMIKFLLRLDNYLFNPSSSYIGLFTFLLVLFSGSWLLYVKYYSKPLVQNSIQDDGAGDYELLNLPLGADEFNDDSINNKRLVNHIKHSHSWKPYNCWSQGPPILLACSWFILNLLFTLKLPINKAKNLIAWIFYVILHFLVPIFVGFWLYLFQPSGALGIYAVSIGLQNMLIAFTHLIFPNAPPLYIKLYGENKQPTYDMIYADGITRQDMKIGQRIYKAVYYATPHKFASLPSIHSSMTSLIFFYVSYYSRWTLFKILAFVYLLGQWWSALYLDHHWRFDLLVGLVYSILVFTFFRICRNGLGRVDENFIRARLRHDFKGSSTMGMRIFKNTRFQNLFDPLA